MKYGIISDIHGNQEALEVAVHHLEGMGVETFLCLGDVVGYGANPNACMNIVRELTDTIVAGNHDHAAVGLTDLEHFNQYAKAAAVWTADNLDEDHRTFIKALPLTLSVDHAIAVHSTPYEPQRWAYLMTHYQFVASFGHFTEKICFIGHSHQPILYEKGAETIGPHAGTKIALAEEKRYIVNVGSVGQPRDNDARLCCCVYDSTAMTVELVRLEYNIDQAQEKIRKAGLPEFLARRLAYGE